MLVSNNHVVIQKLYEMEKNKALTYSENFYVREYWGNKDKVNFAIEEGDIFVTYTNYETSDFIMKTNIENFYIYYYKK